MSDEQNKEPVQEAKPEDQFNGFESKELSESDKKIAAKRAKKHNISIDLAEASRLQELNAQTAQRVVIRCSEILADLGFIMLPALKYLPNAIQAGFDLRPMSAPELEAHEKFKKTLAEKGEAQPVAGSEAR